LYRGSKSRIEIRQGKEENYRPELYVIPNGAGASAALERKIGALASRYPGIAVEDHGGRMRVTIPDQYRVGHEAHFAQVAKQFFEYMKHPETFPAWENPNMLAKYHVTTKGVELAGAES
jgi:hypothetical protein